MQQIKIIQKRIGYSNSVLIANGRNSILVDTGVKSNFGQFGRMFASAYLQPADIKLIVLTHTHYDHTGNLHKLVKLTGAKVLVHKNEFENLKNGFTPIPHGQFPVSRFITGIGKMVWPKFASPKPFQADLVNEGEFDLSAFGVDAKVISTPGHSTGSQSVLIDDTLIAGDMFFNLWYGAIFPFFADDPKTLLKSWEKIFDYGVSIVYPGHGPQFNIEKTFPVHKKWKAKLNF